MSGNRLTVRAKAMAAGSAKPFSMVVLAQEIAQPGAFGLGVFVQRLFEGVRLDHAPLSEQSAETTLDFSFR